MTRPRLVLDTNVLLSALLFPSGSVSWIRASWRNGRIRPIVSWETTTEFLRVLACPKFGLTAEERQDLRDDYLPCCETVAIPDQPPPVPECRDSLSDTSGAIARYFGNHRPIRAVCSCIRIEPRKETLQRIDWKPQRDGALRRCRREQPRIDNVAEHPPSSALGQPRDA